MGPDQHITRELFIRVAAGDEQSFRQIFHHYAPRLNPFVLNIVKSEAFAEEIVQDVFLKLWVNRVQVSEKDSPSSWLFTVAAHQSFSFLKKRSTERRFIDSVKKQMLDHGGSSPTEDIIFSRENEVLLQEAMNRLPPQRQAIYRLSRTEGLTHKEIADKLNISSNTVKNQLVNAIRSIREYVRKSGALLFILGGVILLLFFF